MERDREVGDPVGGPRPAGRSAVRLGATGFHSATDVRRLVRAKEDSDSELSKR